VFPNPTNDVVYVSYASESTPSISLYNLNGELLNLTGFIPIAIGTQGLATISLSNLPAGVYIVSVSIGENVVRKKVVKW
jgi:hypothetical protein